MHNYPIRSVENNELSSSAMPAMRMQVAPKLEYMGNLKSSIYDMCHIDCYYFVERDAEGSIERLVYVQFEGYFPDNDYIYNYPNMTPLQLGKFDFPYDGGVRIYHQNLIEQQRPDSDIVQTVKFLKEKGAVLKEGEYYGSLRMVHLMGEEKKRDEILIFYLERLEEADIPVDVIAHSREAKDWPQFSEKLLARAMQAFKVCED